MAMHMDSRTPRSHPSATNQPTTSMSVTRIDSEASIDMKTDFVAINSVQNESTIAIDDDSTAV